MTNREKYIDSMTDKELALFLSYGSQIVDNQIDTSPSLTDDGEKRKQVARNCNEIEKWLSQETEKSADDMFEELGYKCVSNEFTNGQYFIRYDFSMINNGVKIIKIADGEYECYCKLKGIVQDSYITKDEDKAIHKKIEEIKTENKLAINCKYAVNKNQVSWTMTADEMFKELGYEEISDCEYKRIKPDKYGREVFITVDEDDGEVIKYIKDKELNASIAEWISNKELKAIYKKIEELKNER